MLNKITSAGTAAKKRSKCSLLADRPLLLAIPMLCAVFCQGQTLQGIINTDTTTTLDTVKVVLMVSDTAHVYDQYYQFQSCEDVGCKDTTTKHKNFVSHFEQVKEDKGNYGSGQNYWVYGYEVRRKQCCINGNTSNLAYYQPIPYYTHLLYLDDKRQPLKSTVIVWQSVPAK